jgi:hypothetical protein
VLSKNKKKKNHEMVYVCRKVCCNLSVLAPRATGLKIRAGLWGSKPSSFMQSKPTIFTLFYLKKILGFDSAHKCSYLSTTDSLLLVMHHFSLNYHDMSQKTSSGSMFHMWKVLSIDSRIFCRGRCFQIQRKKVLLVLYNQS